MSLHSFGLRVHKGSFIRPFRLLTQNEKMFSLHENVCAQDMTEIHRLFRFQRGLELFSICHCSFIYYFETD